MANIFTNAVKFLGSTLNQVATNDTLKDFKHASKLFVGGGSYRLSPKNSFLFHVFIDVNDTLASRVFNRTSKIEIGLMAKSTDLPKYTFEVKTFNAYNRINLVQNKVKYDDLTLTFHDDNANVVRNFYYDYFKYYFRDSDYGGNGDIATYKIPYKYNQDTIGMFGFSRRKDSQENFIRSIRIYSLHQKRFSEYILINPVIKSFRHGNHVNSNDGNTLEHTMVFAYENLIYQDGSIAEVTPDGFASLQYYDLSPSPLRVAGGVKSIFGTGGLLDTAGSVLGDLRNGNYLSAIFKTARGINTARGMNLKKALISEVTGIYTQEASNAVIAAVQGAMTPTNRNGYNIGTLGTIPGTSASGNNGIIDATSVATLAGAAVLLNSTPLTNKYKANPTINNQNLTTTYNPSFPNNPGVTTPTQANTNLRIVNDQPDLRNNTMAGKINKDRQVTVLDQNITTTTARLKVLDNELAQAQTQKDNTSAAITTINSKISAAQALTPPSVPPPGFNLTAWTADKNRLLNELAIDLKTMTSFNTLANNTFNTKKADVEKTKQQLDTYTTQKNQLITNG